MSTSRLNSPRRGKGKRASNPERGSGVPRRSGRGRRPSAPTEQNRASHSGLLAQEARLAFGLGWFGIGLGLAELLVPRRFARTIGVPYEHHRLIRAMGVREIANGLGILIWPSASGGIWARVVGDMIDLACLGAAFSSPHANRSRLATTAAAPCGGCRSGPRLRATADTRHDNTGRLHGCLHAGHGNRRSDHDGGPARGPRGQHLMKGSSMAVAPKSAKR